jgi:hypothetical protein
MIRLFLGLCLAGWMLVACKEKKKVALTGEEPVEVTDFIEFFPEVALPFTVADTTLSKKIGDSALIAYSVFTQFVPDSVLKKDFGSSKPKLYPLGRVKEKGKETYLFAKAVQSTKRVAYLITFDNKNNYLKTLTLVRPVQNSTSVYGSLDRKFQITTYRERKDRQGELLSFKRNVYIYNSASNDFTLILTEPNQEMIEDVINPIDTLPQKNKYTGDYVSNKKNFVSFRDGRNPSEVLFFTHFEKNKGECVGELKGTARFVSAKTARYKEVGNPCTLEFTFTSSSVAMKEIEGCGSYRNIQCFFEGTYPKKKKKSSKNNN